jgi:hypothetical protein
MDIQVVVTEVSRHESGHRLDQFSCTTILGAGKEQATLLKVKTDSFIYLLC